MRTPDQQFKHWVHIALGIFLITFIYFLCADLWMPMTSQARVIHPVVNIAAKVGGPVEQVFVNSNQRVKAGDTLFSLDKRPFQLAVDKAELALSSAKQSNQQLDASIEAAHANTQAYQAQAHELQLEVTRLKSLRQTNSVAQQTLEQTTASLSAMLANLSAAKASANALITERGLKGEDNLLLRQASNELDTAKLQLAYTDVKASVDGIITNLQLMPGKYASAGNSVAALVANRADIIADFREKSLSQIEIGHDAAVVFDALPGQVFTGKVSSVDAGVKNGQIAADGNLADTETSDRWIRDAQNMRIHIVLNEQQKVLSKLPTGARATVQLFPHRGITHFLGETQIWLISLLHYIY